MIAGLNDPAEILHAIKDYAKTKGFAEYARATASTMVTHLFTDAGRTWRQAARKNSQGRIIFKALRKEMQGPVGMAVHEQIQRNAEIIKTVPNDIARRINRHILSQALSGTRSSDMAEQIRSIFPQMSDKQANLIARTETSKTSTALTRARSERIGAGWYVWRTSEDARVRDSHKIMDKVLVKWTAPPSPEQLDGMRRTYGHYHAGDIFNCFPGSENINLANGCYKLWRRWYEGTTVSLSVSDGTILQATPNHPVLTTKGWLPIDQIQKGDYLIHSLDDRGHVSENNQDNLVTSFDDLFNALARFCPVETSLGTKLDFHGDGTENDIDVINVDRFLTDYLISEFFKSFAEFDFARTDSNLTSFVFDGDGFFSESMSRILSAHGLVGLANNFFAFLDRKAGHADEISFTARSSRDVVMAKDFPDCPSAARVSICDGKLAFAAEVPRDYLILWKVVLPLIMKILGQDNTPSAETIAERFAFGTGELSDTFETCAFSNQLREVVDVAVGEFKGHVYNLQSNGSWYIVTNGSLIVHNCRCYPEPVIDLDFVSWPAQVYYGGQIQRMTRKQFELIM